jgi:predicted Zn-dependent protease
MAAAVATGEPGLFVAAQAANVAMQLRWSREFEAEADQSAVVLTQRTGYDPGAITHFFERVLAEQRRLPAQEIPPYLYSHPEVESRIAAVEIAVEQAEPVPAAAREGGPDRASFEAMQTRLALLVDRQRASLAGAAAPGAPERTRALLEEAEALADAGRIDEALATLGEASGIDPGDPRIPFRQGELLDAAGRHREAILAYRRTLALDATRALVFFRLGEAWAALGDRGQAVYAFEQARDRSGAASPLRQRAEWELAKQAYGVLGATGVAGVDASGAPELGVSRESIPAASGRVAWWGRLSPRFEPFLERISVRWIDPAGTVVRTAPALRFARPYVGSVLELDRSAPAAGLWRVEALIDDDVIDRRSFRVQASR